MGSKLQQHFLAFKNGRNKVKIGNQVAIGHLVVVLQEQFHIISLPENIYFVSYLPMAFSVKESFYILGVSIISSIIFSSFALSQILSINPSRILKN